MQLAATMAADAAALHRCTTGGARAREQMLRCAEDDALEDTTRLVDSSEPPCQSGWRGVAMQDRYRCALDAT